MANGREGRTKKSPVTVRGPWIAMPLDFLRSRAWAELSPHAAKMLFDLCAGLGPNAKGNGDLSAAPSVLRPRGWTSNATLAAALAELEAAELICVTRRGNRKQCALFAVTLWPLFCDPTKVDVKPGSFTTLDWERGNRTGAERPTADKPAKWAAARKTAPKKIEVSPPATGEPGQDMHPPRGNLKADLSGYAPATGANAGLSVAEVPPPRVTFLDSPSGPVDVWSSVLHGGGPVGSDACASPALKATLARVADGRRP